MKKFLFLTLLTIDLKTPVNKTLFIFIYREMLICALKTHVIKDRIFALKLHQFIFQKIEI